MVRLNESRDALVELIALAGPKPRLVAAAASLEAVTGRYASARARLLEALRHASAQDRSALAAQAIYFDFDSSSIRSSEQSKLQAVASALRSDMSAKLLIEVNCDERGTEEYNRSLG